MTRLREMAACVGRLARGRAAIVLLTAAALATVARGQGGFQTTPGYPKGAWPPVSTSITTVNGWAVLVGRTTGNMGQVVWQVPLAPRTTGPYSGVTVQHGIGTTYVTVGQQQFVVDNATGETHELMAGRVWRRFAPTGEIATPSEREQPPGGEAPAPTPTSEQSEPTGPTGQAIQPQQQALRELMAANDDLARAADQWESVRNNPQASPERVRAAQQAVAQAKAKVAQLRQRVQDQLAAAQAAPAPTTQPAPLTPLAKQSRAVQEVNDGILYLTSLIDRTSASLQDLQNSGASKEQIEQTQNRLEDLNEALSAANLDLRREQMRSELVCPAVMEPKVQARLQLAEQAILDISRRIQIAENRLARIRAAQAAGQATSAELGTAMSDVLAALQQRYDMRQEIDNLCRMAEAGPPAPQTQPSQ